VRKLKIYLHPTGTIADNINIPYTVHGYLGYDEGRNELEWWQ
jgi:hypothetical protein